MKTNINGVFLCNPLCDIRLGTDFEKRDVEHLASLIVDHEGKGIISQNHWMNTASILISGLILYALYSKTAEKQVSLLEIRKMLSPPDPGKAFESLWSEMETFHVDGKSHPVVSFTAKFMIKIPVEEAASIISSAKNCLNYYIEKHQKIEVD